MEYFKEKKWLPGLGKVVRAPIDVKRNVPWSCHTNKELPFKVTAITPTEKDGVIIPNVTKTKIVKKLDCVLYTEMNKVDVKTVINSFLYICHHVRFGNSSLVKKSLHLDVCAYIKNISTSFLHCTVHN